jgi:hypothetical protein
MLVSHNRINITAACGIRRLKGIHSLEYMYISVVFSAILNTLALILTYYGYSCLQSQ